MRVYKVRRVYEHDLTNVLLARREKGSFIFDGDVIDEYTINMLGGFENPYRAQWKPQWVMLSKPDNNPNAPIVDFSYLASTSPLGVTQRVYDALGDVMDDVCTGVYEKGKPMKYGELLPLKGEDDNNYYLFRPPVIDALDESKSDIDDSHDGEWRTVHKIYCHTFIPERLEDAWLFYLATQPGGVNYYATEQFKERVEAHGFTNLPFDLVWDSEDPDFVDERFKPAIWQTIKEKFAERQALEARVSKGREALAAGQDVDPDVFVNPKQEQPLSQEDQQVIHEMLDNTLNMLNTRYGKRLRLDTPARELVEVISQAVDDFQQEKLSEQAKEHRSIEIGVLWAEQVCREHGYHWARVNDGG